MGGKKKKSKKSKKTIRAAALCCGYVESSMVSTFLCLAIAPFESKKDAMESLAKDFLRKYKYDVIDYSTRHARFFKCCAKAKKGGHSFCPDCGRKLHNKEFEEEFFASWLVDTLSGTADNWGESNLKDWDVWKLGRILRVPFDEFLVIDENAEIDLARLAVDLVDDGFLESIQ